MSYLCTRLNDKSDLSDLSDQSDMSDHSELTTKLLNR